MPPRRRRKHPPLGAHLSVAGGLVKAFAHGAALECEAAQIFVKNASRWQGRVLDDEEAAAFRTAHAASRVGPVLAHASYLINLAASDPLVLARSRAALDDELRRCARLGIGGLVVHPGAHLGCGTEAGVARVAASLDAVLGPLLAELPDLETRVLLENTAGQGSCLGCTLAELAAIRRATTHPEHVGFCLDTCHAFAAGYAVHLRRVRCGGRGGARPRRGRLLPLERLSAPLRLAARPPRPHRRRRDRPRALRPLPPRPPAARGPDAPRDRARPRPRRPPPRPGEAARAALTYNGPAAA